MILLYFHSETLSLYNTLYFIPYILLSRIVIPLSKTTRNKLGTKLAALSNSYTYFYTYIRMLTKGVPAWHPTGVKFSHLHEDFLNAFNIGALVSGTFIAGFLFVLISKPSIFGNYNTYVVLGWTFYSVFWHGLFLTFVLRYIHPFKLAAVRGSFEKAFLHIKTYAISALCFILTGWAVYNFTAASMNPQTPTRVALASIIESPQNTSAGQVPSQVRLAEKKTEPSPMPIPEVVEVTEVEKPDYSFTVEAGDTQTKLAAKALTKYQGYHSLVLSERQTNYIAALITKKTDTAKNLKPGQEMSFDESLIEESVENAIRRKI